jgi:hypothetical protein
MTKAVPARRGKKFSSKNIQSKKELELEGYGQYLLRESKVLSWVGSRAMWHRPPTF